MDLLTVMHALDVRDTHEDPRVRDLSDSQVIALLKKRKPRRRKRPTIAYRDPTGDMATARADRRSQ